MIYGRRGGESSYPCLPAGVPRDNTIAAIVDQGHVARARANRLAGPAEA